MRHTVSICAIALMASLSACSGDVLLNESTEIPGGQWSFNDVRRVSVDIQDTLSPLNFYILLRHSGQYEYQNAIVLFKTYFPDNTFKVDTIDCPLADPSGRWYGSGLGDLLDNQIMFKRNVQMPSAGTYNFELQHAMRADTVHEIYDIGLMIERAER